MTQTEIKAWELIDQMPPVQQYELALKILQRIEPKDREEVVQLVLSRKQEMEDGSVEPISLEQFTSDIRQRINEHRS